MVTVIYPFHNRKEYTELTFPSLLASCLAAGDLVDELRIYDDMSTDGASQFVQDLVEKHQARSPFSLTYIRKEIGNSRYQINDTVTNTTSPYIIKVDNDILAPDRFVSEMCSSIEAETWNLKQGKARMELPAPSFLMPSVTASSCCVHTFAMYGNTYVNNIGGVGIFRRSAFDDCGLIREPGFESEKRFFGFTALQNKATKMGHVCARCGWVDVIDLDKHPGLSRAHEYAEKGWGRLINAKPSVLTPDKYLDHGTD